MAIASLVAIQQTALWPQGDIRDPLGVWGFRLAVTGDASSGTIKVTAQVPADLRAAYVYTCYSLNYAQIDGDAIVRIVKGRLLTNWPNIDLQAGVQAYATGIQLRTDVSAGFTNPEGFLTAPMVSPNDRFILLFNFQQSTLPMDIVEMEMSANINTATYSFEGYGYFWDRSVMNAPGGLRHPGSS